MIKFRNKNIEVPNICLNRYTHSSIARTRDRLRKFSTSTRVDDERDRGPSAKSLCVIAAKPFRKQLSRLAGIHCCHEELQLLKAIAEGSSFLKDCPTTKNTMLESARPTLRSN